MIRTPIIAPTILEAPKLRVAIYSRVSTSSSYTHHSIMQQRNSYLQLIESNPNWEFVGSYSDEAVTGTKSNRRGFSKMIEDYKAGLIDMIITKSVSRFARNTVTLLQTVRDLKRLDVDVFFEEQNIHSISGDGELVLSLIASFAQAESKTSSDNVKWRIRKDFEQGIHYTHKLYGYKIINKEFVINPEEAKVVKEVFTRYINGDVVNHIAKDLGWTITKINRMLENISYTGNLILQKSYINNHIEKKEQINEGVLPRYYVEDHHDPIIDMETFCKAQELRAINKARYKANIKCNSSMFYKKLRYQNRTLTYNGKANRPAWRVVGKFSITEKKLKEIIHDWSNIKHVEFLENKRMRIIYLNNTKKECMYA